jgi:ABC-type transport system involved in multi-copper enzyme maturation permease subunit
MRLVRAELLKIRRRQSTWVMLIVALVLMGLIFLIAGIAFKALGIIEFPQAYSYLSQFTFGLGGLLAVVYAASYVGADWNWGVVRNVVARGESRTNYLLAKAAALAIVLAVAVLIMFGVGLVLAYVTGALYGVPVSNPLRGRGLQDLFDNLVLGYPVLLERAALGFAVAVILRSQLAGAVIAIILFLGESILKTILTGLTLAGMITNGFEPGGAGFDFQQPGPEWYQFLPISVGDYVVGAAPGTTASLGGGLEQFLLKPVPLEQALTAVVIYGVIAMVLAVIAINRQEIA